ncbi:MAG: bifunctional diaminohydroxyphosphoribosylaminopyrimidine deaminase/5-amino-6-(5-phosphoribosylamino)uracil reductase RibD [Elstera sp.]
MSIRATDTAADERFMTLALRLARRGLGQVWPSVAVGCVLVKDGAVIAQGWTQAGGRPHAEIHALAQAGEAARGSTAYVSLEPCAHYGRADPCCDALVAAGIARAVIALEDPDPRTSGQGIARMRAGGIQVDVGTLAEEASAVAAGFLLRVTLGRPLVTVKIATSLDGRIAAHTGASRWITGEQARAFGHRLRAEHDAIAVGGATALMDDPALDCRLPGLAHRSPVRVIIDGRLSLPLTAQVVRSASWHPTWVLTRTDSDKDRQRALKDAGVRVLTVPLHDGQMDLPKALALLGEYGLTRLLVEGGGRLIAGLLSADLIDALHWFRAPSVIGGDGISSIAAYGVDTPDLARRFRRVDTLFLGEDLLESYTIER